MASDALLKPHYLKADKLMLMVNAGLLVYALALASWHQTWAEALLIGGGTVAALTAIYHLSGGTLISRMAMATGLMVMTALNIHQGHGMIEMHFGVFVLIALLLFYRDWVPLVVAAGVIAVHHITFFYMQQSGSAVWILASLESGWAVIFLHAGYVVVETAVLSWMAVNLRRDAIQAAELTGLTERIMQRDSIDLTLRSSGATALLQSFDRLAADRHQTLFATFTHDPHQPIAGIQFRPLQATEFRQPQSG